MIYNPFKAHIVQFHNGKYAVRQLNLFPSCWLYLGCYPLKKSWWTRESGALLYASHNTLEGAKEALRHYQNFKNRPFAKRIA